MINLDHKNSTETPHDECFIELLQSLATPRSIRYFHRHQLYPFLALGFLVLLCPVMDVLAATVEPQGGVSGWADYLVHIYADRF